MIESAALSFVIQSVCFGINKNGHDDWGRQDYFCTRLRLLRCFVHVCVGVNKLSTKHLPVVYSVMGDSWPVSLGYSFNFWIAFKEKKRKHQEFRKGSAHAEALVFILGLLLVRWSSAAAVGLVEGAQGAVFVALQALFAAHPAPRAVFSRSRGGHGVRHAQEWTVAAWGGDVAVHGLLLMSCLRALGPRSQLLDVYTLGDGVGLEDFLHFQRVSHLVSCNHPALEVQIRSKDEPPCWVMWPALFTLKSPW